MLGYKFEASDRSWRHPVRLVMEKFHVDSVHDLTEESILRSIEETEVTEQTNRQSSPPPMTVEIVDGFVRVSGATYLHKAKLRHCGFRSESSANPLRAAALFPRAPLGERV